MAWIEGQLLSSVRSGKIGLSALCIAEVAARLAGNNDPGRLSIRAEASSSWNHFAGAKVGKSSRRALIGSQAKNIGLGGVVFIEVPPCSQSCS